MTLAKQLTTLIVMTILGYFLVGYFSLNSLKTNLIDSRKHEIQHILTLARNQALIYVDKAKSGEMTREQAEQRVVELLSGMRQGTSYVWANDDKSISRVHPRADKLGKPQSSYTEHMRLLRNKEFNFVVEMNKKPGSDELVQKVNGITKIPGWNWVMGIGVYMDNVDQVYTNFAMKFIFITLPIVLIVAVFAGWIVRTILKNMGGEPSYAMTVTQKIAQGDLTETIEGNYSSNSLLGSISMMQNSLKTMVQGMQSSASKLSESSTMLNKQVATITRASKGSSDAAISTAAAIQEMSSCIKEISVSSERTEENSERSLTICQDGEVVVNKTGQSVNEISHQIHRSVEDFSKLRDRSNQIVGIVDVIRDIAEQTNLLALNAAIEAARAGEQGRGFAVVADEVRALASRTAKATSEITETNQIIQAESETVSNTLESLLPQVESSVANSHEVNNMFANIKESASDTLTMIREVSTSTQEQQEASDELARHIDSIANMVKETSDSIASCHDTVQDLNALAVELEQNISGFRIH